MIYKSFEVTDWLGAKVFGGVQRYEVDQERKIAYVKDDTGRKHPVELSRSFIFLGRWSGSLRASIGGSFKKVDVTLAKGEKI